MAPQIVTPAQRHLRDAFGLDKWLDHHERKRSYFCWCDEVLSKLTPMCGGEEPPSEAVVLGIMSAVRVDATLVSHVDKKSQDFFSDDDNWEKVFLATSAVIYHAYLFAKEQGRWPEQ
jgi:hypothetical protein